MREWNAGIREFNAGRYWEAHERWEHPWRRLKGMEKDHVQALIQLCGVLVLLEKGRIEAALRLALRARALRHGSRNLRRHARFTLPEIPGMGAFLARFSQAASLRDRADLDARLWLGRARRLRARSGVASRTGP